MAHANEFAAAAQPFQRLRGRVRVDQRQPADHASHKIDLAAEIEEFFGLPGHLVEDLNQDGALDAAAHKLGAQIFGREVTREAIAGGRWPRVGVARGPPEVMMRIDHFPVHTGSRLSTNAFIPMRKSSLP